MASTKKQKRVKTISKGGYAYTGSLRNGKVTVRSQRTAHGQNMVVGTLVISTKEWQNDKNIPGPVKREFEKTFLS